jgi:glycosyltransferase involved in cell wall biosynthesis
VNDGTYQVIDAVREVLRCTGHKARIELHLKCLPVPITGWPTTRFKETEAMTLDPLPELPLVSIVTPSYNRARFIEETILSIQRQDYPRTEHIVVDGGSSDGTLDILKKYNDYLTWISEPDRGNYDAINKGFMMAHGEILAWLNTDDTYAVPDAVSTAVRFLLDNPQVGMVYGRCNIIDEHGQFARELETQDFDLDRLIHWGLGSYICQPATFFRREVLDTVGPLDTSFPLCADRDLWIRIGQEFEVRHIPQHLANFRLHPGSLSVACVDEQVRDALRVGRRHGAARFSPQYGQYLWLRFQRTGIFSLGKRMLPSAAKQLIYALRGLLLKADYRLTSRRSR